MISVISSALKSVAIIYHPNESRNLSIFPETDASKTSLPIFATNPPINSGSVLIDSSTLRPAFFSSVRRSSACSCSFSGLADRTSAATVSVASRTISASASTTEPRAFIRRLRVSTSRILVAIADSASRFAIVSVIFDFCPCAGEYLLRLGFSGRDQLAFLTFALHLRALADLPHFVFELRQARLDVGGHLIRFGTSLARLFRFVLHVLVTRGQRVLDRLADEVKQHAQKRHHVHEFRDPRRDAQKFGAFMLGAMLGVGTRDLRRCFLRAVRDRVRRLRLLSESRCAECDEQRSDEHPHNGLP